MTPLIDYDRAIPFAIPRAESPHRKPSIHEGLLIEGPQGWGEFSPDTDDAEVQMAHWLTAAIEGGTVGWPDPVRGRIPIAITIFRVSPDVARQQVAASGCRSAEVAVTGRAESLSDDAGRVDAVRDALGPDGGIQLRVTAHVEPAQASVTLPTIIRAAGEVDFVQFPVTAVESAPAIATWRRLLDVRIAVAVDQWRETTLAPADVVVLRTGPLGGVRRSLRVAERWDRPCVVASCGETSIGGAASLALAGSLPELPFDCPVDSVRSLTGDLVSAGRSLRPAAGYLPVAPMPAAPDPELLRRYAQHDPDRAAHWRRVLQAARVTVGAL